MFLVRVHDEGVLGILIRAEDEEYSLIKYWLDGLSYSALMTDDEFTVLYAIEELDE